MEKRVSRILEEKVNPKLLEHHGYASLVSVKDGVVTVRMEGACATCPDALVTFENTIKVILKKHIPELKDVALDHSADDEMIQIARQILRREITM